jgi:hypothetical protein
MTATCQNMQISPDGVEIDFTDRGHGEVVLLVHAGVFGAWSSVESLPSSSGGCAGRSYSHGARVYRCAREDPADRTRPARRQDADREG